MSSQPALWDSQSNIVDKRLGIEETAAKTLMFAEFILVSYAQNFA
jgi:hypothetical protein